MLKEYDFKCNNKCKDCFMYNESNFNKKRNEFIVDCFYSRMFNFNLIVTEDIKRMIDVGFIVHKSEYYKNFIQ